jgi:hypothetical protein
VKAKPVLCLSLAGAECWHHLSFLSCTARQSKLGSRNCESRIIFNVGWSRGWGSLSILEPEPHQHDAVPQQLRKYFFYNNFFRGMPFWNIYFFYSRYRNIGKSKFFVNFFNR